ARVAASVLGMALPGTASRSLHDARPIWTWRGTKPDRRRSGYRGAGGATRLDARPRPGSARPARHAGARIGDHGAPDPWNGAGSEDRKSTRLNSSHVNISYGGFCLKKKNT